MFKKSGRDTPIHSDTVHGTRSHWARRPSTVLLLGLVWVAICAYVILKKAHIDTSRYNFHIAAVQRGIGSQEASSPQQTSSKVPTAECTAANLPAPAVVHEQFADAWGHMCVPLRQACYDEGTFVLYHPSNHPQKGGKAMKDPLPLGNNRLGFRDLGDVYGVMQYPEIVFRPNNSEEEPPDLQHPTFSNCSSPVVLYLNHLYMFGDFMIRTMPTFINAINSGVWDRSYTLVIATGGQKLQQWHKLMLQPLTQHPIVTLSVASSREVPLSQQQQQQQRQWRRRQRLLSHAASLAAVVDASSSTSSTRSSASQRHLQQGKEANTAASASGSSAGGKGPQPQRPWQQWQQQSYQRQQQQQTRTAALHFGYKQQVPQQWQQWQQQWEAWKHSAPAAAAASAAATARSQQQQLYSLQQELTAPMPAITTYGRCFESLTVCSIQDPKAFGRPVAQPVWSGAQYIRDYWVARYGAQYKQLTPQLSQQLRQPKALRVVFAVRSDQRVRSILNTADALKWCNSWKPIDQHNILSSKYSKTVCVAYEFGRHGRVLTESTQQQGQDTGMQQQTPAGVGAEGQQTTSAAAARGPMVHVHDALAEAVGTVLGFMSGRQHRKLLEHHRSSSSSSGKYASRQLQRSTPASSSDSSSSSSIADDEDTAAGQQPPNPSNLPLDPDLDPRALLSDVAVLDESDVVIGIHGAQLYNALFMAKHKSLVEIRPYQFTGGWPDSYFRDPLVEDDKSDGIFWWGVDTTKPQNSAPGHHEQAGSGCCHERDRHTRMEPTALDYVLRRIIWCDGNSDKYKQLHSKNETHITDTLQLAALSMSQQQTPTGHKQHQGQQSKEEKPEQQGTGQQHTISQSSQQQQGQQRKPEKGEQQAAAQNRQQQQQQQRHNEEDDERRVEELGDDNTYQQQHGGRGADTVYQDGNLRGDDDDDDDKYFVDIKVPNN